MPLIEWRGNYFSHEIALCTSKVRRQSISTQVKKQDINYLSPWKKQCNLQSQKIVVCVHNWPDFGAIRESRAGDLASYSP